MKIIVIIFSICLTCSWSSAGSNDSLMSCYESLRFISYKDGDLAPIASTALFLPIENKKSFYIFTNDNSAQCELPDKPNQSDQDNDLYYLKLSIAGRIQYLEYNFSKTSGSGNVDHSYPAPKEDEYNLLPQKVKDLIKDGAYKVPLCLVPAGGPAFKSLKKDLAERISTVYFNHQKNIKIDAENKKTEAELKKLKDKIGNFVTKTLPSVVVPEPLKQYLPKGSDNKTSPSGPKPLEPYSPKYALEALDICEKIEDKNIQEAIRNQRTQFSNNTKTNKPSDNTKSKAK